MGPDSELADTVNTQPAIFTHSHAAFDWPRCRSELEAPAFLAGHSLGELSAFCAAGAITFEDGVRLARERGRLMKLAGEAALRAVWPQSSIWIDDTLQACAKKLRPCGHGLGVVIANDNCPGRS